MATQTQTIFICDRCSVQCVQPDAHSRPKLWLSLKEQRSDREYAVLPLVGADLCADCADAFLLWMNTKPDVTS